MNTLQILEDTDIIDIEALAKAGKKPEKGKQYRIRVDREQYVVSVSQMTGREILALAGKTPVERYRLDQKLHGGQTQKIELDDVVDFTTPGIERFMTLPLDIQNG